MKTLMLISSMVFMCPALTSNATADERQVFAPANIEQVAGWVEFLQVEFRIKPIGYLKREFWVQDRNRKSPRFKILLVKNSPEVVEVTAEGSVSNPTINLFMTRLTEKLQPTLEANARAYISSAEFEVLRRKLIGRNVEARLALPVWLRASGVREFPPGKTLKPGEIGTITEVFLCRAYPAIFRLVPFRTEANVFDEKSCATAPGFGRDILVVLLNGAQPRPQLEEAKTPGPTFSDGLSKTAESLRYGLGGYLDRIEIDQRRQTEQQEAESLRRSVDGAKQEKEREYRESGPEIVLWLDSVFPSVDRKPQADALHLIGDTLDQLVKFAESR